MSLLLSAIANSLLTYYDPIVANWTSLTATFPSLSAETNTVTISFSVGSSRTIRITYNSIGAVYYVKNGGTGTLLPSNSSFTVATGDTVKFTYLNAEGDSEHKTVSVYDDTRGGLIDTIPIDYTGT